MAQHRTFADGLRFPEGPTVDADGMLCVVELEAGSIRRFRPDGSCAAVVHIDGTPNGLALGDGGVLYVCDNGGHWVAGPSTDHRAGPGDRSGSIQVVLPDGTVVPFLTSIDQTPLSSPNDVCLDASGNLWFTDPIWTDGKGGVPPGAVCFSTADGDATRVVTDLVFPNGIAITPDGSTLVVCETGKGRVVAYPILGPGRLGDRRTWGFLGRGTLPDGCCFDAIGRLLVAGQATSQIFVFPPGGGELAGTIELEDLGVTNMCFWGEDGSTLFVTESSAGRITAVEWDERGARLRPTVPTGNEGAQVASRAETK